MRTWILGWLVLALAVIGFTLFTAQRVSAQTVVAQNQASATTSASIAAPTFLSGNTVTVSDSAVGSQFLFASQVQQTGTVSGDLVALSGSTVLSGVIDQDVYVTTGTLVLEGEVRGNLFVLAGQVILAPGSRVDGSVIAATERLEVAGTIGSSLQVWARDLLIQDTARITTLNGQVETLAQAPESQVADQTELSISPADTGKPRRTFWQIAQVVFWSAVQAACLVGLLWYCTKSLWPGVAAYVPGKLSSILAWGLTLGLMWPALALFFLATILGFPIMVVGTGFWLAFLWLGWLIPALALTAWLPAKEWQLPRLVTALLLGAVWGVLMAMPVAGWVIRIFSGLFGLGMVCSWLWAARTQKPKVKNKNKR